MKRETLVRLFILVVIAGLLLFGQEAPMIKLGHQYNTNFIVAEEDVKEALREYMQENPTLVKTLRGAQDAKLVAFVALIAEIETGPFINKNIRTTYQPEAGSSAWGKWQITMGLLENVIEGGHVDFTVKEMRAIEKLLERQGVALLVGGRDRKLYEFTGEYYAMADYWAELYGYESVDAFLDDFDYGGTLGLANDKEFLALYTSVAKKLLALTLKQADGDLVEAAGIWYSGLGNRGPKIEKYKEKFSRLLEDKYSGFINKSKVH